jgi:hypothetical protein
MRNASIGKLRLRPLRKCSGAWKRVKTVDWNPSDAHQTSGVRHITVANLQFDPFPAFQLLRPQSPFCFLLSQFLLFPWSPTPRTALVPISGLTRFRSRLQRSSSNLRSDTFREAAPEGMTRNSGLALFQPIWASRQPGRIPSCALRRREIQADRLWSPIPGPVCIGACQEYTKCGSR